MKKPFPFALLGCCILPVSAPSPADTVKEGELADITVTAQNRSLRSEGRNGYTVSALRSTTGLVLPPREIPQSVSVLTKKQLEDQGITDLEGALQTATGINVFKSGGRTHFMSRGYFIEQLEEDGIATQIGSPGGFGLGGPYGDPSSATDLALYDRIEVVRGAAGLTQANNEPGGTVNAVRKKPTAQRQLSADLSADRFGRVRVVSDASGTLNREHALRGRFVGSIGGNRNFKDESGGRDILLYGVMDKDIGDKGKLTWGASYLDQTETPDPDGLPMRADGREWKRSRYLGADWNNGRLKKHNFFAEYEHYFTDNWKLSSKLDSRKTNGKKEYYTLGGTGSGIGADGLGRTYSLDRYDTVSRQFTFQNNLTGRIRAFGQSHDLFFMHSYSKERYNTLNRWLDDNGTYDADAFDGSEKAKPDWDGAAAKARGGEGRYQTHALGLGARINPTDKLHIIMGGRYTRWHRSLYWDRNLKDGAEGTHYALKRNRFVPYAGITYDITPRQSVYAAYTSIFKQTMNRDQNDNLLPPIMGRNYEIGWKGEWKQGRLNSAIALYRTDKDNNNQRVNARPHAYWVPLNQSSRGLDAEVSGSLSDRWQVYAGYTFNRSTNRSSVPGNLASRQKGYDFSSHTPKHMFRLYTGYVLPVDQGRWTLGLGVRAGSKTANSSGTLRQGGYALWNTNVQYRPHKNLQLGLAVNNLTDKRYYENQYSRSLDSGNFYGEPRNAVFSLKWKM
ncbi:MAG: TonB-dependent siderophore receptor [Neisseria sp.]|nr:TonB-dependent siderophore receptor [Neisseria sp.]